MKNVTGMVQTQGKTYRIARLRARLYEVTRIWDDAVMGVFFCGPPLELVSSKIHPAELMAIAQLAVRMAKTSWGALPAVR
jgi:hypothetical protein